MKSIKALLITSPVLGIICAAGVATAETGAQPSSPATQPDISPSASAKELTAMRCLICHGNAQAGQRRLAPPFMMVKRHYQSLDKEDFVKTITSWVNMPGAHKSRMPGAVNHFGLMPTLGYPEAEVKAIAEYVYGTNFPMVVGRGMGAAQGQGCDEDQAGEKKPCCKECDPATAGVAVKGRGVAKANACADCESEKGAAVKGRGAARGHGKGHAGRGRGSGA